MKKMLKKALTMAMAAAMAVGMMVAMPAVAEAAETKVTVYFQPGSNWSKTVCFDSWTEGYTTNLTETADITAWNLAKTYPKMNNVGNGWYSVEITNPSSLGGFQFVSDGCYYDDATKSPVGYWSFGGGDWFEKVSKAADGTSVYFSNLNNTCTTETPADFIIPTVAPTTTDAATTTEAPAVSATAAITATAATTDAAVATATAAATTIADDETPKTADTAQIMLFAVLGVVSLAGVVVAVRKKTA